MSINEKLKQWEDRMVVDIMREATKPIVYVVSSGVAGKLPQALIDARKVIILDKIPEHSRQIDEILDYGPVFEAHVEIKKRAEPIDDLRQMSNNQPRNREHGWYRQFDKNSKKRNKVG